MDSLSNGVFERNGGDQLDTRVFYCMLGLVLLWGLGLTAGIAHHMAQTDWVPSLVTLIFAGLVIPILGILLSIKSDNAFVSFLGYNMIVVPFGFILAPVCRGFDPNIIQNAFFITACVAGTMMVVSTMLPNLFENLGGVLLVSLFGLLAANFLRLLFPELGDFTVIDWIGALVFSLYVGYDWYRAGEVPKTLDNAVDVAVALYLDIVNLFLYILRILAKAQGD